MPKKGFKHSEATKELMRISAENRIGGGMIGKHHSDISNQKNRESHLGKIPWNKGLKNQKQKKYLVQNLKELFQKNPEKECVNPI